jgi:hypothetical protein
LEHGRRLLVLVAWESALPTWHLDPLHKRLDALHLGDEDGSE